jgi:predicted kinase
MNATDKNNAETTSRGTMVFTMGLPAAGKSYIVSRDLPSHTVLDPDEMKKSIEGYDPKNPHAVHAESQRIMEAAFGAALIGTGDWVIDGTGTNAEKMVRRITQAKAAGYTVELLFVTVSLATSLKRNAARDRVVPENVVRSKALDISTAFEIVAPHADTVKVVDNEG